MGASLPSSHGCPGNHCSCSLSMNAECSFPGEKHIFGLDKDEFLLHFDAPLRKRQSFDLQIDPSSMRNDTIANPAEASECDRGEKDEDDCSEQSFRESFYSSGTDWSCLYSVDDYGMPCESIEMTEMNICKASNEGESGIGLRRSGQESLGLGFGKSGNEALQLGFGKSGHEALPGKTEFGFGKLGQEALQGKLVQSTLSACWGFKPQRIGNEGAIVDVKKVADSDIWAKFRHPPASPVVAIAGPVVPKHIASRGLIAKQGRSCPFYKKIPGTSFTVDAFCYGVIKGCTAYFLTHFHSDHYGGLTKSWAHGPIYCTPITARLLALCLYVDERWIHPVPLGTTQSIDGVEVKMLDANHCPGAAIILFRLKNGQAILHTGDFRACRAMQSYPEFRECHVHTLYLDTTYCNQRYRFPLQKEVIDFVIQVTQAALKKNNRTLVVVGAYSIGKERVYLGIAEALNVPIFAERRRSRILRALEWPELVCRLCADGSSTLLHVLPIGFLRPQKLKAYLQGYPRFNSILAFRPTGWTYSEKIGNQLHLLKPIISGTVTVYGVPYSEHSSFSELKEFVQFLQPERIIPTVNVGRPQERDQMQSYFRQWLMKRSQS